MYLHLADNSSPMSPPIVNSYSPQQNNLCDQNQVTSTLENQAQDHQQNPMSPMPTNQASQPPPQPQQPTQQPNEMPNIVDPISIQPQIVDQMNPYRRSGKSPFTNIA